MLEYHTGEIKMNEKKYRWDIAQLEKIKNIIINMMYASLERKQEDIQELEEMIAIANNYKLLELFPLKARFCLLKENYDYMENLDDERKKYIRLLERKLNFSEKSAKKRSEEISEKDLLDLMLEFIEWLPSKTAKQILIYYYHKYFDTHIHFSERKNQLPELGVTYSLNYYSKPFVFIRKTSFIDTFFTLVHELGHVLFSCSGIDIGRNKNGEFFYEISGQYFERLATKFLIEKNIQTKDVIKTEIDNYYLFKTNVIQLTPSYLWETFFTCESARDLHGEIYSYLGSLELIERYNYDYEKQLVDFLNLYRNNKQSMEDYLNEAKFNWRQDEFKVLEKHKAWLCEMKK